MIFQILIVFKFIFGLICGSFVNVVILRLPFDNDIVWSRSSCPQCDQQISWYDNIPVLSFVLLRGKCRKCSKKISYQYPLVELWHGLLAVLIFPNWWEYSFLENLHYLSIFLIASLFTAHVIVDLRHHLLLDKINLALLVPCLYLTYDSGNWGQAILGGIIGLIFPLGVTWVFYKIKGKIGLGGGDIKLFGIIGILFGVQGVFLNLFTSCLLGSLVTIVLILSKKIRSDQYIPFGPYIIAVAVVQILFPEYFSLWKSFLIPY